VSVHDPSFSYQSKMCCIAISVILFTAGDDSGDSLKSLKTWKRKAKKKKKSAGLEGKLDENWGDSGDY